LEILTTEWQMPELGDLGFDLNSIMADLNVDLPTTDVDAEPQIDRAEELRKEWKVEAGQLWQLGEHRLLCGDSTKRADVDRVMGGEKASVCLTDPPYGLGDGDTAKNDYATYDDTTGNLRQLIAGAIVPLIGQMRVVFTPGNKNHYEYPKPSWTMAWFCPAGVGRGPWGFCCWQPILCYGKDAKLASGKGSHPDALVHQEGPSSDAHPCAKPMKLWLWLLDRVSDRDDVVYEPFSGSGTTIIACEQLGRSARAIELSPGYVAVALQRFKDATGKTPTLVVAK
jgi:DNA modification methylase